MTNTAAVAHLKTVLTQLLVLATVTTGAGASCSPGSCSNSTVIRVSASSPCTEIQQAFDCIPNRTIPAARVSILVSPGLYREQLRLPLAKGPVSLLGLGDPETVIVAADQMCGGDDPTVACGALQVLADDFVLSNVTLVNAVENRVVPAGKPFAIEVAGDRAALYNVRLLGKDDTVFTGRKRVYFRSCWINGSTDFNFGQGSAVYDRCTLLAQPGKYWSFVTAHSGNGTSQPGTAYLIQDSRLPYSGGGARKGTTYLGRPWGPLATVIYKNSWLGEHIAAEGWSGMRNVPLENVTYAEFNSSGPGSNPTARVSWSSQLNELEAAKWTPTRVLQGWQPPQAAEYPN